MPEKCITMDKITMGVFFLFFKLAIHVFCSLQIINKRKLKLILPYQKRLEQNISENQCNRMKYYIYLQKC